MEQLLQSQVKCLGALQETLDILSMYQKQMWTHVFAAMERNSRYKPEPEQPRQGPSPEVEAAISTIESKVSTGEITIPHMLKCFQDLLHQMREILVATRQQLKDRGLLEYDFPDVPTALHLEA